MEMIAPMAKLLAEANGIDWRTIQGSGDGGTIVEQDILTYLTRVMSGEEEPPSTPVDEPPPDWNGEMPPMPSMEMLTQAGIESDITDFVATSHPSGAKIPGSQSLDQDALDFELDDDVMPPTRDDVAAQAPGELYTPQYATETPPIQHQLDAPIDLHDDEEALQLDRGPAAEVPSASQLESAATRDDVSPEPVAELPLQAEARDDVARDDVAPATQAMPEPAMPEQDAPDHGMSAQVMTEPVQQEQPAMQASSMADLSAPASETPATEPQAQPAEQPGQNAQQGAQAAGGFGLGGLLSRLYKRGKPADAQPEVPQPAAKAAEPVTPPVRQEVYAPTSPAAETQPSMQAEAPQPEPVQAEAEPMQAESVPTEPVLAEHQPEPTPEPQAETAAQAQSASSTDSAEDASPPALGEPVPASDIADSPISAPLVADQLREPEAEAAPVSAPSEAAPQEPMSQDQTPYVPAPGLPHTLDRQSMGARQGVHLHLSVNTQALEDACAQLEGHLDQPVAAELLVARAAARSLSLLGLSSVGVARLDDQTSARSARQLHGADLRAAVTEYHADESGDWADLMVVDAGQLGLDELHLLGDLATLSLGQRDNHRAALTLTGMVSPQAGAAFLKAVSDQLQKPIQLMF